MLFVVAAVAIYCVLFVHVGCCTLLVVCCLFFAFCDLFFVNCYLLFVVAVNVVCGLLFFV